MNKVIKVLAVGVAAAAAAAVTSYALGAGAAREKITADLTLIGNGELIGVHFSPSFEENLTEKEKIVYDALKKGISSFERRIDISSAGYTDAEELTSFLNQVINTHPDWNQIDDEVSYTVTEDSIVQIQLNYISPEVMLSALWDEYTPTQTEVDHALSTIEGGMTDVEKALVIHDYLVREVDYCLGVVNGEEYSYDVFTLKGVFVDRIAVCQGYALAYSYLLEKVGIESMVVASHAMNHAWNMVNIDGVWYHVDATWDDPTNTEEVDFCRGGFMRHDYFLRSDDEFRDELEHFGWERMIGNDAPKATVSNAFDGWSFRPINEDGTEALVGMLNYVDGYFYSLSDLWGSDVMVKSKVNGTEKTEIPLPEELNYLFYFKGKLYGSNANRVLELNTDGSLNRIVAAASGMIRNFWLKLDNLAYYEIAEDGSAKKKIVDLEKGAENLISENGFTFVIDDNGNATLVEYTGAGGSVLEIPASVDGHPVTKIGSEVFKLYKGAEKVIVPSGVVSIGDSAFMQSTFSEVILPDTLVSIGDFAFYNCNNILEFHIPRNVEKIGILSFYACFRLQTVFFHGDVPEYWGGNVFGIIEENIEIKHLATRWGWTETDGKWTDPNGVSYRASLFGTHVLDINRDGIANGADVAFMIDVVRHPEEHLDCNHLEECNCNGDETADENDAVYMLWELIRGFDD